MQELDNLIEKLNTDKYSAVSVFDIPANRWLFRNKSHQEITEEYQSAEDFFEDLFAKGHRNLSLTLKRKNGSTHKIDGEPFDVNFSAQSKAQTAVATPVQQAKPMQVQDVFSNSFGLGTLDVMNLMVAKNDASRLHTENEVLKSENKELKKKYEEIREEQLASKYDTNKSKGNQEMLLGAIQQLPTLISFVKGTPVVGLSAPVETYESEAKQNFAMALQHIDDTVVGVLDSINKGLNTNNEFSQELAQLLKKHQLWEA
jgi:thiol-disulfide isomerase/thioredoxin